MNLIKTLFFIFILTFVIGNNAFAKRGCCSWHDGVNHCDTTTGRIICNDSTYSPSCMCERDSNNPKFRPDNNQSVIGKGTLPQKAN